MTVLLGLLVSLLGFIFSTGYERQKGLLGNLASMTVVLSQSRMLPYFEKVEQGTGRRGRWFKVNLLLTVTGPEGALLKFGRQWGSPHPSPLQARWMHDDNSKFSPPAIAFDV